MSAAQQFFSEDDRYEVRHSCRFESVNNAHLHNTPSGDGNLDAWTFSAWVKLSKDIAGTTPLFAAGTNGDEFSRITFISNNKLAFMILGSDGNFKAAYKCEFPCRDFSAWYHICVAVDTGQSTNTNRAKLYVNGTLQTVLGGGDLIHPDQNYDTHFNDASYKHWLGSEPSGDGSFDGYMAEVNWVDGLQLDPTSFTETDSNWGHLKPKRYTGAYGTNGFHMNFHSSGNLGLTGGYVDTGANYAVVNLAASDQCFDSPTNNFAQWNVEDKNDQITLSNAGTRAESGTNTAHSNTRATMGLHHKSGKWYCECLNNADVGGTTAVAFGLSLSQYAVQAATHPVSSSSGFYGSYHSAGTTAQLVANGAEQCTFGIGGERDIHQVAYDSSNGKFWYGLNNTWRAADGGDDGDPAAGTNESGTLADNGEHTAFVTCDVVNNADQAMILNSGTDSSFLTIKTAQNNRDDNGNGDFTYAPPTGFMAMCTKNLPTPKVLPHEHFNATLYTGNGSTQSISNVGFQPDWVWLKNRTVGRNHGTYDVIRGANEDLMTNNSDGETTRSTGLTAFGSDGFSLGSHNNVNENTADFVSFNWNCPTTFSNDASATSVGTIDSEGRVNQEAGFSIIKYVGVDQQTTTVAHGLTVAPEIVLVKATSEDGRHWRMYANPRTYGIDRTDYLKLNDTAAKVDDENYWNDSNNTTTTFSIGDANDVNDSGCTFIAYCFHEVEGYSHFGVYNGNGDADGTYFHTGFKPAWVMVKHLGASESWWIWDSKRNPTSGVNNRIGADVTGSESTNVSTGADYLEFRANGIKHKGLGGGANESGNGGEYLIMAFADVPFKYANAHG